MYCFTLPPIVPRPPKRRGKPSRLSVEQIRAIYSHTGTRKDIAKEFGISYSMVGLIKSGARLGVDSKNGLLEN